MGPVLMKGALDFVCIYTWKANVAATNSDHNEAALFLLGFG